MLLKEIVSIWKDEHQSPDTGVQELRVSQHQSR